jgi:hypothetical protein
MIDPRKPLFGTQLYGMSRKMDAPFLVDFEIAAQIVEHRASDVRQSAKPQALSKCLHFRTLPSRKLKRTPFCLIGRWKV